MGVVVVLSAAVCGAYGYARSDAALVQRCSTVPDTPFSLQSYGNAKIVPALVRGRAGFKVGNVTDGNYLTWVNWAGEGYPPVTAGQAYAFEAYVVGPRKSYQVVFGRLDWRGAGGKFISSKRSDFIVVGGGQGLQRVLVSDTAPAQARRAMLKIIVGSYPRQGAVVYVASARFEPAARILSAPPLCHRFVPVPQRLRLKGFPTISHARKHNPFGRWLRAGARKVEPCPIPHTQKECPNYDQRDIPIVHYNGALGIKGWKYNPLTIADNGLGFYSSYLFTHDKRQLQQALRDARWLVRHETRSGAWRYSFKLPFYETDLHWASAMAQGGAVALLERIWHLTGKDRYLAAAKRALRPFRVSVLQGGVLNYWRGKYPFYEEASSPKMPSFILNGYMYALIGLYDMAWAAPKSAAGALYKAGYRSLVRMVHLYDCGPGRSVYDLSYLTGISAAEGHRKEPAPPHYNASHVEFLEFIDSYNKNPNRVLQRYIRRWSAAPPGSSAVCP